MRRTGGPAHSLQIEGAGNLPAGICRVSISRANIGSIRHACNGAGAFANPDIDRQAGWRVSVRRTACTV